MNNYNGILASAANLRLIRDAVAGAAADPAAPGSAAKLLCAAACLDDLIAAAEGRGIVRTPLSRRSFLKPAARRAKF
jgi:hypothetical protein